MVGIPGRVVHQSGVRINPLAHSALPDAEAKVIRNLMDRIDSLEQEVQELKNENRSISQYLGKSETYIKSGEAQSLKDKEIVEIFGDEI